MFEFGLETLLSNGTFAYAHFRANPVFDEFSCFLVSERNNSLCSQIGNMSFVFRYIKTRLFSAVSKVVRVSGAGQTCVPDTVSGPGYRDNISILTD